MNTATILIGNSDDKLKQSEWSEFVKKVHSIIMDLDLRIHFHGTSVGSAPWQNACWVVELKPFEVKALRQELSRAAFGYHQDSIALVVGMTQFVESSG